MFGRTHNCEWKQRAERLLEELQALRQEAAFVDPGTGAGNPAQLELQFQKLHGRWVRAAEPFSLVVLSLSDARRPHDELPLRPLAHMARILLSCARSEDSVCRLGSGEFAVLLASSGIRGASSFLERARDAIAREPIRTSQGTRFYRSLAGAAEWLGDDDSLAGMLARSRGQMHQLNAAIWRQSEEYRPAV